MKHERTYDYPQPMQRMEYVVAHILFEYKSLMEEMIGVKYTIHLQRPYNHPIESARDIQIQLMKRIGLEVEVEIIGTTIHVCIQDREFRRKTMQQRLRENESIGSHVCTPQMVK